MRFTTARLCGGEALMAISAEILDLDMRKAAEFYKQQGCNIKQSDDLMLLFDWNGMEVTMYPVGKVMYYPLQDKGLCIKYATQMIEEVKAL